MVVWARGPNGSAEGKATRTESKRQSSEQKAWGCMDRMHICLAVSIVGCDLASSKAPGVNVEQTHKFYDERGGLPQNQLEWADLINGCSDLSI